MKSAVVSRALGVRAAVLTAEVGPAAVDGREVAGLGVAMWAAQGTKEMASTVAAAVAAA